MRNQFVMTAVAALTLIACGDSTSPTDELTVAQQRWASWGPASYDLILRRGACECSSLAVRPMVVVVRGGAIESKYYLDTGEPLVDPWATFAPDVPGLFSLIAGALSEGHTVESTYDPVTGAPREIVVDREAMPVDGGYSLTAELRRVP
jgi:hypothetical protein